MTRLGRRAGIDGDSQPQPRGVGPGQRRAGDLLPRVGRLVLWAAVAVVFLRGVGAVLSSSVRPQPARSSAPAAMPWISSQGAQAFADGFARVYLTFTAGRPGVWMGAVAPYLASGLRDRAAAVLPLMGPGQQVAQATVARSRDLGSGRALITVASLLVSGRTLYLSVPVARDDRGGLDVFALPALTAPPAPGSVSAGAPTPLRGMDASEIGGLVKRFLSVYVSGRDSSGLSYLVAPGTVPTGMPSGLTLSSLDDVGQLSQSGSRMVVQADVHVRDLASGASYPLAYRLELVRSDRWYVTGVQGGPQA